MKRLLSVILSAAMLLTGAAVTSVNADEVIKVACVGDSITQGLGNTPYPNQLQELLGDGYEVGNYGLWGTTVKVQSDRAYMGTESVFQNSLSFNPDVVLIMLGTNDGGGSCQESDEEAFKEDFRTLINSYLALETNPDVYIATSPYAYIASNAAVNTLIIDWQKDVAEEFGLPLIDMHAVTTDKEMYFQDGLHPNDAGYYLVAQTFYEEIFASDGDVVDVTVNTQAGAKIQLDRFFVYADEAGVATLHIASGEKTLKITCNGYSSVYETVNITADASFDYPLTVQKNLAIGATVMVESTSTLYPQFVAQNMVDGDYDTRWQSDTQVKDGATTWAALDLGSVVSVDKLIIYWETARAAVDGYTVQISSDGENWVDVNSAATTGAYNDDTVILAETVSTRYIRLYMTAVSNSKYDNPSIFEFEVYGPEETSASELTYNDEDMTVTGIADLTAVSEIDGITSATDKDGNALSEDGILTTGSTVTRDGKTYTVIILGDVNGDGKINSTDFVQIRKNYLGLYEIQAEFAAAADVDKDGEVNSTDFMRVRRHYLALFDIFA